LGGWAAKYDSAPGYSYWLALLYWLGAGQWGLALAVQLLLGSSTTLAAFFVGSRLWSSRVGLVAAWLVALYTPFLFYEALLVKHGLIPFACASMLATTVWARDSERVGRAIIAGMALGLLVLLRSNAALLVPVVAWWLASGRVGWPCRVRTVAAFATGLTLLAGPMLARNLVATQRSEGTSLWGIHFYIATNSNADGRYTFVEGIRDDAVGHLADARRIAERDTGRRLEPAEVSWYWFRRGMSFVRDEPLSYLALQARKARLVFVGFEEGSFGDGWSDMADRSVLLRFPVLTFGAICPLGVLGIWLALRDRRQEIVPVMLLVYVASLLPFFVTGRYRLPIAVPTLVLAAVALDWLASLVYWRRWRTLALAAAGLAVVSLGIPVTAGDRGRSLALAACGIWVLGHARSREVGSIQDVAERP
jgi:4-amino-4-deoxy-L-arabinose transferase-like glycosyltransferase